jgi:hypothetical protein
MFYAFEPWPIVIGQIINPTLNLEVYVCFLKIKTGDAWGTSPYPIYKNMCHMYKRMHIDNKKNDEQKIVKFKA